ncbi:MAG TPA: glycosyltransferase family 4 protein [Methanoregulaceae archaeon]|nr:glycosyltransferase family 4 protein [Methanoregulaceae archaeon]HPD76532.1 glycosyltransferase family 4 protein [Methanoregulaceae archaeon]
MKLLLTMGLADRSMGNYIAPLSGLKKAEEILLVRDTPGPEMENVRYVTARGRTAFLKVPVKLFHLIRLSFIEKPALVHGFLLYPHGYLALIAGKLTGRKTGLSLLAGPVETFIAGGSPIGDYAYCRPLPKPGLLGRIVLSLVKKFDVITVTGTFTKDFLVRQGIEEKKIFILPHVVDDRFRPLDIRKDYDLVFVGRLAAVKHVGTLLAAAALVKEVLPSLRVAIVGDGAERGRLEDMARLDGLSGTVDFVGFQENTWEWYNRSRLSILTSEREGFPYTVIESLRCGVPVITSDCGDVRDIVKDAWNGRIVADYDDPRAYADIILELLKNPDRIRHYSENCCTLPATGSPGYVWETILTACS